LQIKYPESDNAIRNLWKAIDFVKNKFADCGWHADDTVAVLYISSLIISPAVAFKGNRLIDELRNLVSRSPKNTICVVRTTAPEYFNKNKSKNKREKIKRDGSLMEKLQKRSIDLLRAFCYVRVYDRKKEFLNHAKFLIFYLACPSEGVIYRGKYYGSTNLTAAGLASPPKSKGNYEEFTFVGPDHRHLGRQDAFYLREIQDLITEKEHLYTKPDFLRSYLEGHKAWLEEVLGRAREVISGTTLGELYKAYVDLLLAHNQTYALLDELPGKMLTEELVDELASMGPPTDPFELEMMMPTDLKVAELLAEWLGFSPTELKELVKEHVAIVENSRKLIEDRYTPELEKIYRYFDEKEHSFLQFVSEYGKDHIVALDKLLRKASAGQGLGPW